MNYRMIGFVLGRILLTEAALMALPLFVALLYGESPLPFLIPALVLVAIGSASAFRRPKKQSNLYARDGFAIVALAWLVLSVFGAFPFMISGDIPHFVDAFFETVSGFTTTGATILPAVEPLRRSILCNQVASCAGVCVSCSSGERNDGGHGQDHRHNDQHAEQLLSSYVLFLVSS